MVNRLSQSRFVKWLIVDSIRNEAIDGGILGFRHQKHDIVLVRKGVGVEDAVFKERIGNPSDLHLFHFRADWMVSLFHSERPIAETNVDKGLVLTASSK